MPKYLFIVLSSFAYVVEGIRIKIKPVKIRESIYLLIFRFILKVLVNYILKTLFLSIVKRANQYNVCIINVEISYFIYVISN